MKKKLDLENENRQEKSFWSRNNIIHHQAWKMKIEQRNNTNSLTTPMAITHHRRLVFRSPLPAN